MLDDFRSTLITWDKATSRIYSPVTANASDENGRKLVVQIVNSGQVEDLTGATLHLYWETRDKAHDGLDVFKAVDLEKGEFELSYTTGMLSNHGVLNANLVLIDTVGRVVSERFKITVTEGIDNDAIQSENSFSSLTHALIDISNLEQNYAPRLNDLTAQLAEKASKQDVNNRVAQIVSGSPKGTYVSLSALQTAKPTGDAGVYLTTDNGHWYWWNGSTWVDGGVYQAADLPISEKSITRNLFDKDAVIEGKQVLAGGDIVNYANSTITPYIDVEGLITLYFSGLPTYTATVGNRYGKFYDVNKSPVGADVLIPTSATTGSVPVPSGAKYFVLSIYQLKTSSEVVDYGIIQIESGGIQTPYVAYQAGVYEIEGKKIIGSNPAKVPLKTKGKALLLFGDSITHTANVSDDGTSYTEGALTNWATYSKATLEVGQMWNYAFGGAAYRDRDGVLFKQKISNQITSAINNNRPGDIIVVAAGTNDQGINMGSYATAMSKTTRESLDRTLFYEAVRWAFWTIRLNYPNAICFASTPVQRAAYEPIPALSNAIKEIARRYNFIIIDAEFESGIVRDFEVANSAGRYLTDGLHPNYDGKILLSKLFNREILNAVNNAYESL